jgi:hypothetical protein
MEFALVCPWALFPPAAVCGAFTSAWSGPCSAVQDKEKEKAPLFVVVSERADVMGAGIAALLRPLAAQWLLLFQGERT